PAQRNLGERERLRPRDREHVHLPPGARWQRPAPVARLRRHPAPRAHYDMDARRRREPDVSGGRLMKLRYLLPLVGFVVPTVGIGHGRTIERAATVLATGFIAGIDLSEEMVRMAERRCRRLIRDGKVTLSVGDSDHLPFLDQHFDKALSVHTVYFWADPVAHL